MRISQKIEYWKNRLLDLSRRNRLINCSLPRQGGRVSRTSILIYHPPPHELWKIFAENDSAIEFPIPIDEECSMEEVDQETSLFKTEFRNGTKTNQSPTETCKTLRSLMRKAKEFREEKGLNALSLAVGFLNWCENGKDGQKLRSPLLLIPVTLTQENLNAPIVLSRFDEEIIVNDSLGLKLHNDFGISLPSFDESDDWQNYLAQVENVCITPTWSIEADATQLALFSFLKMNMYRDLEAHVDRISTHPIVRALSGEALERDVDCSGIDDFNHDDVEPQECFSVVDADSSQQDAILLAKRGMSFVLQGPPGTGKSQTITNVIAELIADGKKVLFVSEKMAALDVVYKRLKQTGLESFCLTLHSHNAKRREILDQLDVSLKLARQKVQLQQEAYSKLRQLKKMRAEINQYAIELHTIIGPLDKTIYQVNGLLAKYGHYRNIDYTQLNAELFTQEQLVECEYALKELSRIVERSGYQQDNPWNGCVLTEITHEFRQQFLVDSANLSDLITRGQALFAELNELLGTHEQALSMSNVLQLLEKLKALCGLVKSSPKIPHGWLNLDLTECISRLNVCQDAIHNRDMLVCSIDAKCESLKRDYPICNQFSNSFETDRALQSAKDSILQEYDQAILSINADDMLRRFKTAYRSGLRFLNPSYRGDRKTLLSFRKIARQLDYSDALVLLEELRRIATLGELFAKQTEIESLRRNLSEEQLRYESERSILRTSLSLQVDDDFDFASHEVRLCWTREFYDLAMSLNVGTEFMKAVCDADVNILEGLKDCVTSIADWAVKIRPRLSSLKALFIRQSEEWPSTIALAEVKQAVQACADSFADLEYWIDYQKVEKLLTKLGIDGYLAKAKAENIPALEIVPVFQKCFYRSWLDIIMPKHLAVHSFRGLRQNETIVRFRDLDESHLEIARAILTAKLIARLPNFDSFSASGGEIALLRREMHKRRKLMSTRKLIAAIPNLLPVLKPCMMMSPLSVGTYLGSSGYEFDTVIFDEASQVRTEDAIGAIFRARQTIIAGDSKQLPPTDFFVSSISDSDEQTEDEDGEVNDTGAYESLLDEAAILPTQTLLWHYRSRHEHLIAFSNAKIYHGNLITFPSSVEKTDGLGVEYVYVAGGVYERGGKNGNRREAEKVSELVFEHFQAHPDRSLGVIAFGEVQQTVIEEAIIRKRRENPKYEAFFNDSNEEPLFIKNLETVQGDERDTIIFSIGYAPDASGKFIMNFGPLSRQGGERRLNVAITRARYNLRLVGSILPTDIDTDRTSGQGPKLLRLYIDFALNGIRAIVGETSEDFEHFDSPFEEAVFDFLTAKGYDIVTQVGCSGYRIDMAVRHPQYNGRFAIGIECDGATYHSARTARERDRLRQTVLEDMGWTIYRVWSTDWIKDPHTEGDRLLDAIEQAIAGYREIMPAPHRDPAKRMTDFMSVSTKTEQEVVREKHDSIQSKYAGLNADDIPTSDFEQTMLRVIASEYGLDKAALFKETARYGYRWQRQGSRIKKKFERAYKGLLRKGLIIEEDGKIRTISGSSV